ncbi:hypothetical protein PGTUg99_015797 [Puccinia graminis f. sp. tritici]|uniref:Uncharacterized protein n=1 Tax=Puccinia graminis f. sp. tritici TaxID=56615 RepID=A0A5B0RXA5_PUCGR|nr:hypothetical protein PGTUg99_015797 [Puccinia graminis f. sp. tritici]
MPSKRFIIHTENRTQQLRRRLNDAQNAATLARLREQESLDRGQAQAAHGQPEDEPIENVLHTREDSVTNHEIEAEDEGEDINNHAWVDLVEEPMDAIDQALASERERHRNEARDFNWDILMRRLHPEYMKLKGTTQNWAGSNCYDHFTSCSPTCQRQNRRMVDIVDIHETPDLHVL